MARSPAATGRLPPAGPVAHPNDQASVTPRVPTRKVYAAVAWGVLQLADIVWDPLGLPPWTMTLVIVLVMMGFPLVLVLEWVFESTAKGVRRTPPAQEAPAGRSLISWPVAGGSVLLLLAVSGAWWFTTAGASDREPGSRGGHAAAGDSIQAGAAARGESALKRLAVLPLANLRSDPELDYLGFALADQIIGAIAYTACAGPPIERHPILPGRGRRRRDSRKTARRGLRADRELPP